MKTRYFHIKDVDCIIIVELNTRKEILSYLDEYIDNMQYDWYDASDDTYSILYKDGTSDFINEEYDGHKIRKQNISSIVWDNPCTSQVFGSFLINEYGVVIPSNVVKIAEGITEVKNQL